MDIMSKIAEINKSVEPASKQSTEEVLMMIQEITDSYGQLVLHIESLTKQNANLHIRTTVLEEQISYLLAKDPEYVAEMERMLAEAKEKQNVETNSVSADLPS